MNVASHHLPPASPHAAPALHGTPRVLLVIEDGARRQALRQLLQASAPECRLVAEADAIDALLSAARMQPDLVVIDGSLAVGAAALTRHLAHLTPRAAVLVFDTPAAPRALPGAMVWTEAPAACARWVDAFHALQRAAARDSEGGSPA